MAQRRAIRVDMLYDSDSPELSALELVYTVRPEWNALPGDVKIQFLSGGVANTMMRITKETPGCSERESDQAAIILRVYGDEPKELVDRELESDMHELLAEHNLASPLFARFKNGQLYSFVPGRACRVQDLAQRDVWRSVAIKMGEFHAKMSRAVGNIGSSCTQSGRPIPNIWSSMRQWIDVLPSQTSEQVHQRKQLEKELSWCQSELDKNTSTGSSSNVVGHCDLLCGNIILAADGIPESVQDSRQYKDRGSPSRVHFIDYDYTMYCPAAFDIANHFSEWGGFDCHYDLLPSRTVRREFIEEYLSSYLQHMSLTPQDFSAAVDNLVEEVDRFRGIPGLWWGMHALVSVLVSKVDFDWIPYSNRRLAEYWGWKAEVDGSQAEKRQDMTLREKMWARV